MKKVAFFKWVSKNVILSGFLGIELICLVLGLSWAISLSLKEYNGEKNPPVVAYLEVVTDTNQMNLVQSEVALFQDNYPTKINVLVSLTTADEAAKNITTGENKMMILSRSLTEKETVAGALKQETIVINLGDSKTEFTLIQNNAVTQPELAFSKFLKDDNNQRIVFQKRKTGAEKKLLKIG